MSWLFSRALVEAYSAACSLDGEPSALSKSTPMPQAYLSPDKMTAYSRLSRFGMTFAPLTGSLGGALLTWFRAGKGAGIDGERSGLWREMARVIREVRPRFVFVENSPMLTIRGLDRVLGDLAEMGYDASWGIVGADDAGAPHRRKRIWILAYSVERGSQDRRSEGITSMGGRREGGKATSNDVPEVAQSGHVNVLADTPQHGRITRGPGDAEEIAERREFDRGGEQTDVPDPNSERCPLERVGGIFDCERPTFRNDFNGCDSAIPDAECERCEAGAEQTRRQAGADTCRRCKGADVAHTDGEQEGRIAESRCQCDWWIAEPDVGRVAHGLAARVDRLKAIGNGQVPAVAALAWNVLRQKDK